LERQKTPEPVRTRERAPSAPDDCVKLPQAAGPSAGGVGRIPDGPQGVCVSAVVI
jgi:hypothetical protein